MGPYALVASRGSWPRSVVACAKRAFMAAMKAGAMDSWTRRREVADLVRYLSARTCVSRIYSPTQTCALFSKNPSAVLLQISLTYIKKGSNDLPPNRIRNIRIRKHQRGRLPPEFQSHLLHIALQRQLRDDFPRGGRAREAYLLDIHVRGEESADGAGPAEELDYAGGEAGFDYEFCGEEGAEGGFFGGFEYELELSVSAK